jgi:hypothetical protein
MSTQPELLQLFDDLALAPALLVEARYRERTLCARLLTARASRRFTVGAGRRADAPVDPRYLPERLPANDNHRLVEARAAGFVINLSPAMRCCALRTATHLRIPCGEIVFDISAATPPPAVPRSWLRPGWRGDLRITGAVALGTLLLLLLVRAVPSDPHALSLDDVGRSLRMAAAHVIPPVVAEPAHVAGRGPAGGGAPTASAGPRGAAGDRAARPADARRATKGPAVRQDARAVAAFVRDSSLLAVLDGQRGGAFAEVIAEAPALGDQAEDVLAHLDGRVVASAYGVGGLDVSGTGEGGADTGRPMLGGAPGLPTIGRFAGESGRERGYRDNVGPLARREPRALQFIVQPTIVRGSLDKEIVRRIVRQHLNEVRFCYEQALVRRPSLAGRIVAQFTIAPTGRVLASALQSSSLGEASVDACIVEATRRWEFPRPAGGGVVVVSYPFQLSPAGG